MNPTRNEDAAGIGETFQPGSIGLFHQVFNRLEEEQDQDYEFQMVPAILAFIAAAREGLYEQEICGLLTREYSQQPQSFHKRWEKFISNLSTYLLPRSQDGNARIAFFHQQMEMDV